MKKNTHFRESQNILKYLLNIKGEAETNDVEDFMSPNFLTRKKKKCIGIGTDKSSSDTNCFRR